MVNRNVLDPQRTGLVVFDMLECYRDKIEPTGAIPRVQQLLAEFRSRQMAVCFARADHRDDGSDLNRSLADTDSSYQPYKPDEEQPRHFHSSRDAMASLKEFDQGPSDYDIPKHRWNAFYQTHLDLSLRSRGVDTIVIVGGSTHVGVASTAYYARDMDYDIVLVEDCCTGFVEQREHFLHKVAPRFARIRTAEQVLQMLAATQ